MKRSKRKNSSYHGKPRSLRLEPLEQRRLLAVASLGFEDAAIAPDTVQPAYAEISQINIKQKDAVVSLNPDAVDRICATGKELTPVEAIRMPETINTPAFGKFPDPSDLLPVDVTAPLPDGVDPSKFPGEGCPDKAPPSVGNRWWLNPGTDEEWARQNRDWDVSCQPQNGFWYDAETKRQNWGGTTGHPLIRDCRRFDDGKGGDDKDTTGTADVVKTADDRDNDIKDKPVEDGTCGQPPIKKDPEPEGGDPDERMFPAAREAAMFGSGPEKLSPTGERKPGEDDPWERHRRKITGGEVDPEDGGPDEFANPALSGAVSVGGRLGGFNAYPTPDDDGSGPPPRPNTTFSRSEAASPTSSASLSNIEMLGGFSSYTDPDNPTGPPRPEV